MTFLDYIKGGSEAAANVLTAVNQPKPAKQPAGPTAPLPGGANSSTWIMLIVGSVVLVIVLGVLMVRR